MLQRDISRCRACPRLVSWREEVARTKVARFRSAPYWGAPVPGFGDPAARILIVGLAPAAHGANRTGRMFTGDRSGAFLFAALHRAGFANQARSDSRADGLALTEVYIVASVRCAPPANLPKPDEVARCAPFLDAEIALLPRVRVFLALGAIAWRSCVEHLERRGQAPWTRRPQFSHGAALAIGEPDGPDLAAGDSQAAALAIGDRARHPWLLGSYHVSQQNTQTGRLTPAMFDEILESARRCAS